MCLVSKLRHIQNRNSFGPQQQTSKYEVDQMEKFLRNANKIQTKIPCSSEIWLHLYVGWQGMVACRSIAYYVYMPLLCPVWISGDTLHPQTVCLDFAVHPESSKVLLDWNWGFSDVWLLLSNIATFLSKMFWAIVPMTKQEKMCLKFYSNNL